MHYIEVYLHSVSLIQWALLGAAVLGVFLLAGICNAVRRGRGRPFPLGEALAVVAVLFIVMITLLSRTAGKPFRSELIPFWSWYRLITRQNIRYLWPMVLNVILFLPLGACLGLNRRRSMARIVGAGLLLSLLVELTQLVTGLGLFEWDDMMHNTLGCFLGAWVVRLVLPRTAQDRRRRKEGLFPGDSCDKMAGRRTASGEEPGETEKETPP